MNALLADVVLIFLWIFDSETTSDHFCEGVDIAMQDDARDVIEKLVTYCISYLAAKEFVDPSLVKDAWNVIDNGARLKRNGMAAAATIESGQPVILYDSERLEASIFAVPHESVHLAQIAKGDLYPLPGSGMLWKDQEFESLPADHEDYLSQPWEAEAEALKNELRNVLKRQYPSLGKYLTE